MSSLLRPYGAIVATAAFTLLLTVNLPAAPSFSVQTFATGTTLGTTQPDSTYFGLGSVWISYQNGSDSTGLFGSSTVVRYSPTGVVAAYLVYQGQCGRAANRPQRPGVGPAKQRRQLHVDGD